MDEIVDLVVKKTGLPREQAQAAVTVVINFIKQKLPAPVAGQVDMLLNNSGLIDAASHALDDGKIDGNDVGNLLGDLFGGKK